MQKKYRYRLDRLGRRITAAVTTLLVTAFVAFHFVWGANYLPAWMLFLLLCVVLLYILSIPRYVLLDDTSIDIHCIVDLTRIHLEDVELIRRIEPDEFRRLWPLLGSYGFWGYFGYYFSFREWNLYKVYASERKNLVLIEDIYEDTFIISCEQAGRADHARHRGTRPQESRDSPPYGKNTGRRECFLTKCLSLRCRHPHCGARRRFAAAVRRSRFSGEPEYRASKS